MSKRLIALLLALVLCVGMLAACGGNGDETTKGNDETTVGGDDTTGGDETTVGEYVAPDLTGVKITSYHPNNTDIEEEGIWLNTAVEKYLGVDWEIIEGADLTGFYAAGKAPELRMTNSYNDELIQLGIDGANINIYDYLDQMPNVKAFLEDPQNAADVEKYTTEEGTMYWLPIAQRGGTAAKYAFLYRKDIFEANNLTFPTNQDEFVATLKKLKELYPDSTPFVMRQMTGNMQGAQAFGHLWGGVHLLQGNFSTIFTLDADGNYYLGTTSNAYKEMAQFFHDLTEQGLMHKSSMTIGTTDWYAAMGNGASFITYDKCDRLPDMNATVQGLDPNGVCVAAAPFNFGTYAKTATTVSTSFERSPTGYSWGIGNTDNLENVLKFVDWLYSEEGQIFTQYGVEGESYTKDADGNITFIESFLTAQGSITKAGLNQGHMSGVTDFQATLAASDPELAASLEVAIPYENGTSGQVALVYNDVEKLVWSTYGKPFYDYALSEYTKFILGQRDFSEWDQLEQELKDTYYWKELLQIHESALARAQGE